MATRKRFELLDLPKFAYPSLIEMNVPATAANILERLGGNSFMSYAPIWPRVGDIVEGRVDEEYLQSQFDIFSEEWKNKNLRDAARLLAEALAGRGRWYRAGLRPFQVLPGAYFKPSIKGTLFERGRAHSVLVNPRKGQRMWPDHVAFLARGVYEFHGVDDPNDPVPLIVDLSAPISDGERELRTFVVDQSGMMSLDLFEEILRRFFEALSLAGVTTIPEHIESIGDLFRKRGSE